MLCCNPASVKLCQTGPQRDELAFPRNPPDSTSWRTQQPDMPPVHQRFPLLQGPSCLLHLPRCMVLQSPTQILLSTQNLSQPHQLIHPTLNTALALDQQIPPASVQNRLTALRLVRMWQNAANLPGPQVNSGILSWQQEKSNPDTMCHVTWTQERAEGLPLLFVTSPLPCVLCLFVAWRVLSSDSNKA
ncbi:PREDICTED: uncharacterized protein LOC102003104 isoform X3 [Chinchilla lanigera]|uniref:uncharacterized protein LOC102003104 isoform X3 n=1 Tax=Chinchilla lanigera TaxID=34839 RepID=UPI00069660C9|nr:PREDICTED: uncharacterized protein LOC102003104 isoform X3 [Chinchilla lanigera]